MMSKEFSRGLDMLKGHAEKNAPTIEKALEIKTMDLPARYYIGIRETVKMEDITKVFTKNLPAIFNAVTAKGLEVAGMPSGLYYTWDEATSTTDLFSAAPLKAKASIDGFETVELPASKALVIDFYGSYDDISAAHEAMDTYLKEKGLIQVPPAIEEYVTDPGTEPDPSKWLTQVIYYYK
jgi:effector-binding domain-containing protein